MRRLTEGMGTLLRTLEATGSGWNVVTEDGDGAVLRSISTGDTEHCEGRWEYL